MTYSPTDTLTLWVNTNNQTDCGTYRVAVKSTEQSLIAETYFELIVIPVDCRNEKVSPDGTLGPIDYYIGSGVVKLNPTFTSNVNRFTCPAKFEIYMLLSDGSKRTLALAEQEVL